MSPLVNYNQRQNAWGGQKAPGGRGKHAPSYKTKEETASLLLLRKEKMVIRQWKDLWYKEGAQEKTWRRDNSASRTLESLDKNQHYGGDSQSENRTLRIEFGCGAGEMHFSST